MPVPNRMQDLSTLASSNYPTGTEAIGNSLDNYLRSHAAIIRSTNSVASSSIAAASTTDIGAADGESVVITGSSTINSFGAGFAGCIRELRFSGDVTINHSANIANPFSRNVSFKAGDVATYRCTAAGVWAMVSSVGGVAYSTGQFVGVGTAVVLAPSQTGGVFLRPNGGASAVGQTLVTSDGIMAVASRIRSGDGFVGTPSAELVLSAGGGGVILRPNGEGSGLNGAFLDAANGDFTVAGNLISNSDERIKEDWRELPKDLVESLASLKRGRYKRIDNGATQVGVGAQSLAEFMPDAVIEGNDGILSVAYGNAALVGVCEVAARLIELERMVYGKGDE